MKEDNNIEDLFRSSFDHFEVAPPPAVKEAIDSKIGGASNKRGGWWIFGLVVLLGTTSLLFFFNNSSDKQGTSTHQLASGETPANNTNSKTTDHSKNNSSATRSSKSSSGQPGESNTSLSATDSGTKKGIYSEGNQSNSLVEQESINPKSHKSAKNNQTAPKKTNGSKKKGVSGKKSAGKKNNTETLGFNELSALDLTNNALNPPGDDGNNPGNSSNEGNGKSDPKNSGTSDTDPPKKTDPVVTDPKENPVTPQAADSTENKVNKTKPPKNKNAGGNWLASLYAGPSFGINSKSNDELRSVSEKPSFQFSAEINRNLFAGYGLSTGFGFNQRQETFKLTNLQILDSAIVINDSIPIYGNPNVPDSITGYQDTTYYYDDTLSTDFSQLNRIQTIGIPVFFTKHFKFSDQWGLLVNAGAVFQFNKVSIGELNGMPAPTINDFSMNVAGRFHLTYTWNQWMFSAGVSTGMELKQAVIYEGLDRKRYFITPQLGFHFRF